MRSGKIVAAVLLACSATASSAQQQVVILGTVVSPAPVWFNFSFSLASGGLHYPGGVFSQMQVTQIGQIARLINIRRDVRCMFGSDLRNTTSHDDETTRWFAASAAYALTMQYVPAIRDAMTGTATNPLTGLTYKAWKITYADGGSENWVVFPDPRSSVKLFDTPLPNSLIRNDGVINLNP